MAYMALAGTCVGYVTYDLIHYYLHHGNPTMPYFKRLRSYHVNHHFVNQEHGQYKHTSLSKYIVIGKFSELREQPFDFYEWGWGVEDF